MDMVWKRVTKQIVDINGELLLCHWTSVMFKLIMRILHQLPANETIQIIEESMF